MFDYLLIEESKRREKLEKQKSEQDIDASVSSDSNYSVIKTIKEWINEHTSVFQDSQLLKQITDSEIFQKVNKNVNFNVVMITFLILSIAGNSFLYTQYQDYKEVKVSYVELYNVTKVVESYYDTLMGQYSSLKGQYSELRTEYSQLNSMYAELVKDKSELENEHKDILNYRIEIQLVTEKTITIQPKQNISETFETPFSGYITVNYTATGEAYTWTGSTQLNGYYSRNPQFPETASTHSFSVPVLPDIILYFANPDEANPITITYCVKYIY
jgi:hypothetical protein